jgi:hypothetical protein
VSNTSITSKILVADVAPEVLTGLGDADVAIQRMKSGSLLRDKTAVMCGKSLHMGSIL